MFFMSPDLPASCARAGPARNAAQATANTIADICFFIVASSSDVIEAAFVAQSATKGNRNNVVRRRWPGGSALDEAREAPSVTAPTELLQRLGFDLADALARHLILAADLLERVLARGADAKAQAQH